MDVESNATVCGGATGCVGKCCVVWRQMPFVVEANAIMCGGNCLWLIVTASPRSVTRHPENGTTISGNTAACPCQRTGALLNTPVIEIPIRSRTPDPRVWKQNKQASTRKHNAHAGIGKARAGMLSARTKAHAGKGMALASEDHEGALVAHHIPHLRGRSGVGDTGW